VHFTGGSVGGVFGVVFGKHPPQNFPFKQRASGHIGGSVGDFLVKLFPDNQNQHLVRLLMKNQSEVPLTSYIHVLGAKISENSRIPKFYQVFHSISLPFQKKSLNLQKSKIIL